MDGAESGRIFVATTRCLASFHAITPGNIDISTQHADLLARFRIWAGNLGAWHPRSDRRSADHRLRDAPEVEDRLVELLEELTDTNSDVRAIVSGSALDRRVSPDDVSEDDSEDSDDGTSELSELILSIGDLITSLMKVSMLVRKATTRDRYIRAIQAGGQPFLPDFDVRHVCDKFPRVRSQQWLYERLGGAITQRRQFLRYSREHKSRLAHEPLATVPVHEPSPANLAVPENPVLPALQYNTAPTASTRPTLTPTAASTLQANQVAKDDLQNLDRDDDAISQATSFMSSHADGETAEGLHVVRLSTLRKDDEPFECTYCHAIVAARRQRSYKKHVYADLRAYLCTFEDCTAGLFEDRDAWWQHEMNAHRRQWSCQSCQGKIFDTAAGLQKHLRVAHDAAALPDDLLVQIAAASSTPVLEVAVSDCPLCEDLDSIIRQEAAKMQMSIPDHHQVKVPLKRFQQHLGYHLEQLALFAVPPQIDGNIESGSRHSPDGYIEGDRNEALLTWQDDLRPDDSDDSDEDDLTSATSLDLTAKLPQGTKRASDTVKSESSAIAVQDDGSKSSLPNVDIDQNRSSIVEPVERNATDQHAGLSVKSSITRAVLSNDGPATVEALIRAVKPTFDVQIDRSVAPPQLSALRGLASLVHVAIQLDCQNAFVPLIADRRVDVNTRDGRGYSALHCAATSNRVFYTESLLQHRGQHIDVNTVVDMQDFNRKPQWQTSNRFGKLNSPTFGQSSDAPLETQTESSLGQTALSIATELGSLEIMDVLLKHDANPNDGSCLLTAVLAQKVQAATLLIEHGADVNITCQGYASVLVAATARADVDMMRLLLDSGADIDVVGSADDAAAYGTPLVTAVVRASTEAVALLIRRGANIALPGPRGDALTVAKVEELANPSTAGIYRGIIRMLEARLAQAAFTDEPVRQSSQTSQARGLGEARTADKNGFEPGDVVYVPRESDQSLRYIRAVYLERNGNLRCNVRDWLTSEVIEVDESSLVRKATTNPEQLSATAMVRKRPTGYKTFDSEAEREDLVVHGDDVDEISRWPLAVEFEEVLLSDYIGTILARKFESMVEQHMMDRASVFNRSFVSFGQRNRALLAALSDKDRTLGRVIHVLYTAIAATLQSDFDFGQSSEPILTQRLEADVRHSAGPALALFETELLRQGWEVTHVHVIIRLRQERGLGYHPPLSLWKAVQLVDLESLRTLVDNSTDMRNPDSNQALALAVMSDRHDFVDALLSHRLHGANPNCVVDDNHVLGLALQVQGFSIASLLMSRGADPALMVHYSHNLAATIRGLQNELEPNVKNICDRLISQSGASFVDAKDWLGRTMLHYAVTGGATYFARQLLTYGVAVDARDNDGQTTMHLLLDEAPTGKRLGLFKLLREYDARIDDTGFTVDRRDHLSWYVEQTAPERMQVSTRSADSSNSTVHRSDKEYIDPDLRVTLDEVHRHTRGGTRSSLQKQSSPQLPDDDAERSYSQASDDQRRGGTGDKQIPVDRIVGEEATETVGRSASLSIEAARPDDSTIVSSPTLLATEPDVDEWPTLNAEPNVLVSTELWFAATKAGNVFRVQIYLREGIDVNTNDQMSYTALHHAAAHGDIDLVPVLLQAGANSDAKTELGDTPLHLAAAAGQLSAVKELISAGADINAKNMARHTALFLALQRLLPETRSVAEFLLQLGASTRMTKSLDVLHALIGNRANRDPSPMMDGLAADMLTMLLDHDSGLQYTKDMFGRTALHTCVQTLQQAMAETLLARGAEVGAKDNDGMTPMQLLCALPSTWESRRADMFRLLVEYGADYDPNVLTADTEHLFGTLSSKTLGYPSIVVDRSQLTHTEPDTIESTALADTEHAADRQGIKSRRPTLEPTVTANDMFEAINMGDWHQFKKLLDVGGDPDTFHAGEPALHRAAERQDVEVLKVLLNGRANTNIRNEQGQTALHRAVQFDRHDTVECLLKFGADHSPIDKLGHTPLTFAASQNIPSVVIMDLLHRAGASMHTLLRQSRTILHIALDKVNGPEPLGAVEWIVKTDKALVNMATQRRRQTSLHMAVEHGWTSCTEVLVDYSARVNVMNAIGQTPMDLLLRRSRTSDHTIFELLFQNGGALSDTAIARLPEDCRANYDAYADAFTRLPHRSQIVTQATALAVDTLAEEAVPYRKINVPESGKFNSTDFDISQVLVRMQEPPPRGMAFRDRRWLSTLRRQCFHGEELTSWLLTAFEDLKDRKDAITLGHALIEHGAIVELQRGNVFRSGEYLYQIAERYRIPRDEVATGLEIVAVVGCIAAVVSAFHGAAELTATIKERREKKRKRKDRKGDMEQAIQERMLHDSLVQGAREIDQTGLERRQQFGYAFERGDSTATSELKDIIIRLQGEVIRTLQIARDVENAALNMHILHDASVSNRLDAIRSMDRLCYRITVAMEVPRSLDPEPNLQRYMSHEPAPTPALPTLYGDTASSSQPRSDVNLASRPSSGALTPLASIASAGPGRESRNDFELYEGNLWEPTAQYLQDLADRISDDDSKIDRHKTRLQIVDPPTIDNTAALTKLMQTSSRGTTRLETANADKAQAPIKGDQVVKSKPFISGTVRSRMSSGRKISLGPRGLAPMTGAASAVISTHYAGQSSSQAFDPNEASSGLAKQIREALARKSSQQSLASQFTADIAPTVRQQQTQEHPEEANAKLL
nr:hypothetical protein B0A51_08281 [Rachicladosporium sp. CCFEE 5018]